MSKTGSIAMALIFFSAVLGFIACATMESGNTDKETAVREAFNKQTPMVRDGNAEMIKATISQQFKQEDVLQEMAASLLSGKRKMFSRTLKEVQIEGEKARLSYQVMEAAEGEKKPVQRQVSDETWTQDPDGQWRLSQFSVEELKHLKERAAAAGALQEMAQAEKTGMGKGGESKGYIYKPGKKRDPFQSLILSRANKGAVLVDLATGPVCEDHIQSPLEEWDTAQLKLEGILFRDKTDRFGMIGMPDGKGYTVQLDQYIGKNCGKVSDILVDRIVITEQWRRSRGNTETMTRTLKLRPEED